MKPGKYLLTYPLGVLFFAFASCSNPEQAKKAEKHDSAYERGSFGYDRFFLKENNVDYIELFSISGKSKLLISPAFQGRVMTSSANGDSGKSFGWLNYKLLSSGEINQQFNPVGGEERIWIGPEGGQFSIYFRQNDSFLFKNWKVPAFLDTEPFEILSRDSNSVTLGRKAAFVNYSGNEFNVDINRKIKLLDEPDLVSKLAISISSPVSFTAYSTENKITNLGDSDWSRKSGLLSFWLLGMFTPSPETYVFIPFKKQKNSRGKITSNYFGDVPSDRLVISDSSLFFLCDGRFRSKIGIDRSIAKPIAAAFDFSRNILTIVIPEIHEKEDYVNNKWEIQKDPFKGDVINAYNDGPVADGTVMGPFFEIESLSPALELKKGESGIYTQTTCHFEGSFEALRKLAMDLTGIDLSEVRKNKSPAN